MQQEVGFFLQVLGMCSFAITQPLLDIMGRSPETFVFRNATPERIVLFALVVALVPAVTLSTLAVTRLLGPRVRRATHLALLGILASVVVIQVVKTTTSLRNTPLVVVAVIAGGTVVWLSARVRAVGMWMRWGALSSVAFVLLFLLLSPVSKLLRTSEAGAAARGVKPVPIVMLVLDELPLASLIDASGEINHALYPNFAELASRSTWYRNYTASETFTRYAIPTMLTGNSVKDRSKGVLAADHPDNIFSLLAKSHRLEVVETITALCPPQECRSAEIEAGGTDDEGLRALVSDAVLVWMELSLPGESTRDITTQFAEPQDDEGSSRDGYMLGEQPLTAFLEPMAPAERAVFHYLHVLLPHVPWRTFPTGVEYQVLRGRDDLPVVGDTVSRPWVEDPSPVKLARKRHVFQLQYTDLLLGRMIDRLHEVGMFDDALVIVTADHGVGLHAGRERKLAMRANMHEVYWVPLFIKAPHQRRGIVDNRNLMAVDLLPTMADMLGTEVPWKTEGRSALDPAFDRGPVKSIVRRPGEWDESPEATLSIATRTAQRRMRREAVAIPDCGGVGCTALAGPRSSLVGEWLRNLAVEGRSHLSATLALPRTLRAADREALPALVLGTLRDAEEREVDEVAVALNGRIVGTSRTWTQNGEAGWFGVLAPQTLVRPERNELRLFELSGSILRSIRIAG
jgi:hypothetical protein